MMTSVRRLELVVTEATGFPRECGRAEGIEGSRR
jgi:hypothetical protein